MLTSTLFLATTSSLVLYAPPTPICCRFLGSTQPSLPAVSALLSPQYGTHSLLTFALVLHHIHDTFRRLRAGLQFSYWLTQVAQILWPIVCTLKDFTYLLTYLHCKYYTQYLRILRHRDAANHLLNDTASGWMNDVVSSTSDEQYCDHNTH